MSKCASSALTDLILRSRNSSSGMGLEKFLDIGLGHRFSDELLGHM